VVTCRFRAVTRSRQNPVQSTLASLGGNHLDSGPDQPGPLQFIQHPLQEILVVLCLGGFYLCLGDLEGEVVGGAVARVALQHVVG